MAKTHYIYGWHPVLAALNNPQRCCHRLYITSSVEKSLASKGSSTLLPPIEVVSSKELDQLVGKDAVHQGLVLQVKPLGPVFLEDWLAKCSAHSLILILDEVTDPHNVGAILRSAAAFGAGAVLAHERHCPPLSSPTLIKAACGAVEVTPMIAITNLARGLKMLKQKDFWLYGLDERAEDTISSLKNKASGRIGIVLGAEGRGLRRLTQENCDALIKLPTQPHFSTLNVSNTAAVALYALQRAHST